MKITNINRYKENNKSGVSAEIIMRTGKVHAMYFEVDELYRNIVSEDASPFLAAMLPIGMFLKEDIEVDGFVSKKFLQQITAIMKEAHSWDQGLYPISIKANVIKRDGAKTKKVGCFFSGGADSFYTFLKNKKSIDTLIFVHGFDVKIRDEELYRLVEKQIVNVVKQEAKKLLKVKTNMRDVYDQCIDWNLAHGFAVGSVSLFLQNAYKQIYVSCGLASKNGSHYAMTPELDPNFSSESMQVLHFGCEAGKLQKLEVLSMYPLAMKTLRVCWVNRNNAYNCSKCEKCMRNMLGLYLCGALEKCETFANTIDVDYLKQISVTDKEIKYFRIIQKDFQEKKDTSVVRGALDSFIQRNSNPSFKQKILMHAKASVRKIDTKYNQNRLYWFMANKGIV